MPERALALALIFAAVMTIILGRLFQLQIIDGERLANSVAESRVVSELVPAMRGRVLDRHGVALADNRGTYQLAVVLADLELPRRSRRQLPLWRLTEAAFDRLLADFGLRLNINHAQLRETVLRELVQHPAVAVRRGAEDRVQDLALIAVPGAALAPDADDGDGATAVLAQSEMLYADARDALVREIALRWGEDAQCLSPAEFVAAAGAIDRSSGIAGHRCLTVLESFAPLIGLNLPTVGAIPGRRLEWRMLTSERREQTVIALTRFLGADRADIDQRLAEALSEARKTAPSAGFYFAPSARADEVASLLPKGQALESVELDGVPAGRERVLILQGDLPGQLDGFFARISGRIASSLGAPGPWVGSLIERHAERLRVQTVERDHRLYQLALDPVRLDRFCAGLSAVLTRAGIKTTPLEVEQMLAKARRVADKEWAGQGPGDPLVIIPEIPRRLALLLHGADAGVPSELAVRFDGAEALLPGLVVRPAPGRAYPFGASSSHIIGTLARVDASFDTRDAQALGLDPSGWHGSGGLEGRYDTVLRGIAGTHARLRSPEGVHELPELSREPIPGQDLRTEIDLEVQLAAEDALARWFELAQELGISTDKMSAARAVGKGRAGMALVDCHTGAILALGSVPGFKIEDLRTKYAELLKAPGEPLHDYAAEARHEPGSALKMLTAMAALELRKVTPGEHIYSPGYMAMSRGKKILRSHAPPGSYDLIEAINQSDNVYFATIGGRVGGELLSGYMQRFGMGSDLALDVTQQRPGLLPTPATLPRMRPDEAKWRTSDTWRLAIGQFSTASPLQVACIAATVANGGHVLRPYLVKPQGAPETVDLQIRQEHLQEIRRGMEKVTSPGQGGTAPYLILEGAAEGIKVAAKTGTSEWGSGASRDAGRTPDHAWLIGYAPADRPTVAFGIFIHSGTSGGRACSAVAKKVLEAYFAKYGRQGHARLFDD
ncbi:MAG: hypothetical protein H0W72_04300 [Planctomycetes bacterium]|nr:hypothetical protein [Planctomycetota bacterium]